MRKKIKINKYWENIITSKETSYDEVMSMTEWDMVHLPHGGDPIPTFSSAGRNFQGIMWYRKNLTIPQIENEEKLLIEFEGVMQEMEIYYNGVMIGNHKCGYTPSVFDLTQYVTENENMLVIRTSNLNNTEIPPGKKQNQLDFNYDGGIYRDVNFIVQPRIYFTHPLLEKKVASGGIYISTLNSSTEEAKLRIQSHIKKNNMDEAEISIDHKLYYGEYFVSSVGETIKLDSNDVELELEHYLIVNNPKLWDAYNPNLYTVISEISSVVNGEWVVIDNITTEIGIRNFEMTYEEGFKINGQVQKVSGGNYHQAFTQLGNAVPKNMLIRDCMKLREAGLTHIRSHYPLSQHFIDACNKYGVMLTVSNPGWQYFKTGNFEEQSYENLRTIIRWLRNNPSIIIWEGNLNESSDMTDEFMINIQKIIHEENPHGSVYSGSQEQYSDILYTNVDEGMIPSKVEEDLRPRWIREYGDSPDNWTDQSSVWRTRRKWGESMMIKQVDRMLTDRYDWLSNYRLMNNILHVSGYGMWPAIEYNRGYHLNACYGGILDLQRIEKYSYYFFKSQRNPEDIIEGIESGPMLYIANSFNELSPDKITIYSNCDTVKIYYDDVEIAEQKADDIPVPYPPFTFDGSFRNLRKRSTLKAEGYINGELVCTEEKKAHGVAKSLHITVDNMGHELVADGSDTVLVRVEARDSILGGNCVINGCDEYPVKLTVSGEGYVFGENIKNLELGVTGFLVKSTTKSGDIKLTASLDIEQPYIDNKVFDGSLTISSVEEKLIESGKAKYNEDAL